MSMEYRETLGVADYHILREAVGWDKLCDEQALRGLCNSEYMISCYDDGRIVGAARVIWDGGYISFLSDVMVIPEYQRMGIGKHMVLMAIDYMRSQLKPGWKAKLVLFSAKGKEPFYRKLGFRERPNDEFGAGMDMWLASP